jgi:uncharacterized OsmC-like protein
MNVNTVEVAYVGDQRAEVRSGGRTFVVDERTKAGSPDSEFCPLELIATSLGA